MADAAALQTQVTNLTNQVQNLTNTVAQKDEQINAKNVEVQNLKNTVAQKDEQINAKDVEVQDLTDTIAQKDEQINAKNVEVQNLKNTVAQKDEQINAKNVEVQNLKNTVAQKDAQLNAKNTHVQNLTNTITQKNEEIKRLGDENKRAKIGFDYLQAYDYQFDLLHESLKETLTTNQLDPKSIEDLTFKRLIGFFITNFNDKIEEIKEQCQQSIQTCQELEERYEDIKKNLATTLECDAKIFTEEEKAETLRATIRRKEIQEEYEGYWTEFRDVLEDLKAE